jgi:hypothetical protein
MRYEPTAQDLQKDQMILAIVDEVYRRVRYDPAVDCVRIARAVVEKLPPALAVHAATAYIADTLAELEDDAIAGAGT